MQRRRASRTSCSFRSSDDEAARLAARIDALPAGGADILVVALIVFLVLLFTDIMGYTKVFPFTRSAR